MVAPWTPSRPVLEPTYTTGVAGASGLAGEDAVPLRQAQGEGVHQDVGVVALVEVDVAAHGGHADAVAVAADAAHHAAHQVRGLGVADSRRSAAS